VRSCPLACLGTGETRQSPELFSEHKRETHHQISPLCYFHIPSLAQHIIACRLLSLAVLLLYRSFKRPIAERISFSHLSPLLPCSDRTVTQTARPAAAAADSTIPIASMCTASVLRSVSYSRHGDHRFLHILLFSRNKASGA